MFDANPYTEKYLEQKDPETGKQNERCDLPFKKELKPKKQEVDEDDSYIAFYSTLFWNSPTTWLRVTSCMNLIEEQQH